MFLYQNSCVNQYKLIIAKCSYFRKYKSLNFDFISTIKLYKRLIIFFIRIKIYYKRMLDSKFFSLLLQEIHQENLLSLRKIYDIVWNFSIQNDHWIRFIRKYHAYLNNFLGNENIKIKLGNLKSQIENGELRTIKLHLHATIFRVFKWKWRIWLFNDFW